MKKPNIEIKEFGAMGPDGYEVVINGKPRYAVRTEAEAKSIVGMIDALHEIKHLLDEEGVMLMFKDGKHRGRYEPALQSIESALKKAGVEL